MYLHLGEETIVKEKDIIGIFDMDRATVSVHTRRFLTQAQKDNKIVNVTYELPKSFVVCENNKKQTIFISQLSPSTLKKRSEKKQF